MESGCFVIREGFYDESEISVVENIKTTEKTTEKIKTREKILSLIKENPQITTASLASLCNLSIDGIDYQIRKLKSLGKLEREGGKNGGHWIILGE